jgi:hypothetical protein
MNLKGLIAVCLLIAAPGEVEEVERIAPAYKAETEVVQWDLSRVDMVTSTHAIEVDFSRKWPEAVGQSLYYSILTGKKPGIVLLVKDVGKERRYVFRCQAVCAKHDIKLWIEMVK